MSNLGAKSLLYDGGTQFLIPEFHATPVSAPPYCPAEPVTSCTDVILALVFFSTAAGVAANDCVAPSFRTSTCVHTLSDPTTGDVVKASFPAEIGVVALSVLTFPATTRLKSKSVWGLLAIYTPLNRFFLADDYLGKFYFTCKRDIYINENRICISTFCRSIQSNVPILPIICCTILTSVWFLPFY